MTHLSILVNETLTCFFLSLRGLRHSDALFPYCFIMAMESLSHILKKVKERGFIEGFLVSGRGDEGLKVSHMLFANDTLILYDATKEHMEHLN